MNKTATGILIAIVLAALIVVTVWTFVNRSNSSDDEPIETVNVATLTAADSESSGESAQSEASAAVTSSSAESTDKEAQKIYESDYVKISFIEWDDVDTMSDSGVPCVYLRLKIDNKYDENIAYSIDDVSINKEMIENVVAGTEITPGSSTSSPCKLFTSGTAVEGITADEIKEISFTITIIDAATSEELGTAQKCRIYLKN